MKNTVKKIINVSMVSIVIAVLCGCGSSNSSKKMSAGEITESVEEITTDYPTESVEMQLRTEEESTTEQLITTEEIHEETYHLTETNDTVYAISVVNVRNKPNVEGDVVTVLNRGDSVERKGTLDNGWSQVSINGTDCYVNTVYLTNELPTAEETQTISIPQETITEPAITTPENAKEIAESYIGKTMDELKKVIGPEVSQIHSASCYYEGEMDGIYYYSNFTVYTHTVDGVDYIDYIE